jgi:isoamylase
VLRRRTFFSGIASESSGSKDVAWLRPDGEEMKHADWHDFERRVIGMYVPGEANDEVDELGRPVQGDTLLLLLNASSRPSHFRLPEVKGADTWELTLSTAKPGSRTIRREAVNLTPHSLNLLTLRSPG